MFVVAFLLIVIVALASGALLLTMRIRLMRMDSSRDRIEWLSFRTGDDVLSTYESLFPGSVLPRFCRFVFCAAIVLAAAGLCMIVTLKTLSK